MIYGYLRVSSDDQDVNSQKQGVERFAAERGWKIDQYITDEGVSGGKNPNKRNLGPLLKLVEKDDVIISSEISRLGRDMYMIMDILHFCMTKGCIIYTVKDKFVLGDDVQSKVLAFAFGLSAEIERQMIQQRTKEGLKLRVQLGVLLGRPLGTQNSPNIPISGEQDKDEIIRRFSIGVPICRLARDFNLDRNTLYLRLAQWGVYSDEKSEKLLKIYETKARRNQKAAKLRLNSLKYKDGGFKIVDLNREKMFKLIIQDLTLPQISEHFPEYTYEQIYDTVLNDEEFNSLYRKHGQLKAKKRT